VYGHTRFWPALVGMDQSNLSRPRVQAIVNEYLSELVRIAQGLCCDQLLYNMVLVSLLLYLLRHLTNLVVLQFVCVCVCVLAYAYDILMTIYDRMIAEVLETGHYLHVHTSNVRERNSYSLYYKVDY
jgi:hypothetical protein